MPAKDDLYLKGYNRGFGSALAYSMGVTYSLGMLTGGTYGVLSGLSKDAPTMKLRTNAILNGVSLSGQKVANTSAVMTLYYVTLYSYLPLSYAGVPEPFVPPIAGMLSGLLYKSASGVRPMALYGALGSGLFTAANYFIQ